MGPQRKKRSRADINIYPSVQNASQRGSMDMEFQTNFHNHQKTNSPLTHPLFNLPIPNPTQQDAHLLNDEVDMFVFRKNALQKFKLTSDLLDNIVSRAVPVDNIIPPGMFPNCIFDGKLFEEKKKELLKDVVPVQVPEEKKISPSEFKAKIESQFGKSNEEVVILLKEKDKEKPAEKEKEIEKQVEEVQIVDNNEEKVQTSIEEKEPQESKEPKKLEEPGESKEQKEPNELGLENSNKVDDDKKQNANNDDKDNNHGDDDNLSDYDPSPLEPFEEPYQESEESRKLVTHYLEKTIKENNIDDYIFGNLPAMKIKEYLINQTLEKLQKERYPSLGDRYTFNITEIDKLHSLFFNYNASVINENINEVSQIEQRLKDESRIYLKEEIPLKISSVKCFDSVKTEISLEDYHTLKGKQAEAALLKQQEIEKIKQEEERKLLKKQEEKLREEEAQRLQLEEQRKRDEEREKQQLQQLQQQQHQQQQLQPQAQVQQDSVFNTFGPQSSQNFDFDNNLLYDGDGLLINENDQEGEFGVLEDQVFLNM